jgi:hypothetical protein
MLAAGIVTVLRFFTLTNLGYDLTLQVQAAQHLLSGQGLKVFWTVPTDLSEPLSLRPLTHFPAGFSLLTAALLGVGLPLSLVTKVYGAALTLAGWLGWGRFGALCVGGWLTSTRAARAAAQALAFTAPLFFTPDWNGTDLILWAAVPWVLHWLVQGAQPTLRQAMRWDLLSGATCGVCVSMRYASLVLAGFAALVILLQCWKRPRLLVGRWLVFGASAAPLVVLQVYLLFFQSRETATPGGVDTARGIGSVVAGTVNGLKLLPNLNYPLVSWAPERVVRLATTAGNRAPWLYAVTGFLLLLPWLMAKCVGAKSLPEALSDARVIAAGLVVAVPVFLWVCTALSAVPALGIRRYYLLLIPLVPFLLWSLAAPVELASQSAHRWMRNGARLFVLAYLAMMTVGSAFLFVPGAHGAVQRSKLMADADLRTFPRLGLDYEHFAARQHVVRRLQAYPKLVLLTNFEHWFYADPTVDRSRVQRIESCENMRGWRITGPARLLIFACNQGEPLDLSWVKWDGQILPAPCLRSLPNLRLTDTFPANGAKVLECEVPAGSTVRFDGTPTPKTP